SYSNSPFAYDTAVVPNISLGYRQGREALERRVNYMLRMDGVTPVQLAQARMDHGDWLLTFRKRTGAIDVFDDAYRQLQAANVPQSEIDALFSPLLPQEVPAFLPHNYSR